MGQIDVTESDHIAGSIMTDDDSIDATRLSVNSAVSPSDNCDRPMWLCWQDKS